MTHMSSLAVMGCQWGDEGKGKILDCLSENYDIVARCQGGSNAGHTVVRNGVTFKFHLLPSGILHSHILCYLGNGMVIHLPSLIGEIKKLETHIPDCKKKIFISDRAHIVFDFFKEIDANIELGRSKDKVGTTMQGIGPAYTAKTLRCGVRVHSLFNMGRLRSRLEHLITSYVAKYSISVNLEAELEKCSEWLEFFKDNIVEGSTFIKNHIRSGKRLAIEGANGSLLDIDGGTYPYVTSSTTTAGALYSGLMLSPKTPVNVVGVVKAYTTRVGSGPFPTELTDQIGDLLQSVGNEFGTTSGRKRRCGWLDIVVARHGVYVDGIHELGLTKLDVLDDLETISVCTKYELNSQIIDYVPADSEDFQACVPVYTQLPGWRKSTKEARRWEDLPVEAQEYIDFVQNLLEAPIRYISVGPDMEQLIVRGKI